MSCLMMTVDGLFDLVCLGAMGQGCSASGQSTRKGEAREAEGNRNGASAVLHLRQASGAPRPIGRNPFKTAHRKNSLRRLRHKVLVQYLYENRAPSPELLKKLTACAARNSPPAEAPVDPVRNPLGDDSHSSIGHVETIGGVTSSFDVTPGEASEGLGGVGPALLQSLESAASPDGSPQKVSSCRRRSRSNLTPQYQAYLDTSREIRNVLHLQRDDDIVTFVVAPLNNANGSVHGQLSAEGCSRSNSGMGAAVILLQRQTLNSILRQPSIHVRDPEAHKNEPPVLGPNVCKRTLHQSPKCVSFLTNEAHMNILRGAADTPRIIEDIKFVRDDS